MAILVTGGAGYIGSHACVELLNGGMEVVVVDNFSHSKPEALKRIRQITGRDFKSYEADLRDSAALNRVFEENEISSVIHFAAFKAVGESVQMPIEYYHNNVAGTLVLLQVMKKHNVKRLVFSSSCAVYFMNSSPPFKETDLLGATNPYGNTKIFDEQILTDVWKADSEWSIMILRYFNVIGAHESSLIGDDPNCITSNLVPFVCQVAVGKLPVLKVFGNDYDTVDGTGVRDYIHVVDLARGHLSAVDYCMGHTGVEIVNLGTGRGYSVMEVVRAIEKVSGVKIKYEIAPRRNGDVGTCFGDPSKAKTLLQWEATMRLDKMCEDVWKFNQNNPNGL